MVQLQNTVGRRAAPMTVHKRFSYLGDTWLSNLLLAHVRQGALEIQRATEVSVTKIPNVEHLEAQLACSGLVRTGKGRLQKSVLGLHFPNCLAAAGQAQEPRSMHLRVG